MNKYKVEFNTKARTAGKSKYEFIFGQTEDSALADASITREQIVGIYLLGAAELPAAPDGTPAYVPVDYPVTEQLTPTEQPPVSPSVQDASESFNSPAEDFSGGGGEFGGAGASGSFEEASGSFGSTDNSSDSSSDFGSGGGEQ